MTAATVLGSLLQVCPSHAQDCDATLIDALKTRVSFTSYNQFKSDVLRVFKLSRQEREQERQTNALGLKAVIEAIPFGLDASSDSESVRTLNLLIEKTEQIAISSTAFTQLQAEMLDEKGLAAYIACISGRGIRLAFTPANVQPGETFIASIEYMPAKATDGAVTVQNPLPAGATVINQGNFKDNGVLKPFGSMACVLKRDSMEPVVFSVGLGGAGTAKATMPKIVPVVTPSPKPAPPPKPETAVSWVLRVRTSSGDDSGTDANVFLRFICSGQPAVRMVTNSCGNGENEAGSSSTYSIATPALGLGGLQSVALYHDNARKKPGWKVSSVELDAYTSCGRVLPVVRWVGSRWLASDEAGGLTFELPRLPHDGKQCP